MDINLKGKNAIVCGASRGIGRATAVELAKLGANVTIMSRSADRLELVKDVLDTSQGQKHIVCAADFSDTDNLKKVIEAHILEHGSCHILVNNSGGPAAGPVNSADELSFLAAFQQHLIGNHIMVQAVLQGMKDAGYGRIINVISTSVKQPLMGLGVSNTVRGAVASWAKTLAGEIAQFGITVNNVLPGATDTDRLGEIIEGKAKKQGKSIEDVITEEKNIIPAKRFGQAEELAQAISFLASPAAAYINGVNLPVDGGRTSCL